jgi:hypothetical protein
LIMAAHEFRQRCCTIGAAPTECKLSPRGVNFVMTKEVPSKRKRHRRAQAYPAAPGPLTGSTTMSRCQSIPRLTIR